MSIETDLQNELTPKQLNRITKKSSLISLWDAAEDVKPPNWLIKHYLELDTLAGIFAPPSSCKSMVAIDIAASVATGLDWHGYKTKKGAVVYVAGEGVAGLKKRTKAWKIRRNKISDSNVQLHLREMSINGQNPVEIRNLIDDIETTIDINETPVHLVIVDTVARNFGSGNENDAGDMSTFISNMDMIRNRWKCSVLLVHHTGHGDNSRARGSSAFRAALDAEYQVTRSESLVELKSTKMKDADEPDPLNFELFNVDLGIVDEDGESVNSAILDLTDKPMPVEEGKAGKAKISKNVQAVLDILHTMYNEHRRRLAKTGENPEKAKVELDDWRNRCIAEGTISEGQSRNWYRFPKVLQDKGFIIKRDPYVCLVEQLSN